VFPTTAVAVMRLIYSDVSKRLAYEASLEYSNEAAAKLRVIVQRVRESLQRRDILRSAAYEMVTMLHLSAVAINVKLDKAAVATLLRLPTYGTESVLGAGGPGGSMPAWSVAPSLPSRQPSLALPGANGHAGSRAGSGIGIGGGGGGGSAAKSHSGAPAAEPDDGGSNSGVGSESDGSPVRRRVPARSGGTSVGGSFAATPAAPSRLPSAVSEAATNTTGATSGGGSSSSHTASTSDSRLRAITSEFVFVQCLSQCHSRYLHKLSAPQVRFNDAPAELDHPINHVPSRHGGAAGGGEGGSIIRHNLATIPEGDAELPSSRSSNRAGNRSAVAGLRPHSPALSYALPPAMRTAPLLDARSRAGGPGSLSAPPAAAVGAPPAPAASPKSAAAHGGGGVGSWAGGRPAAGGPQASASVSHSAGRTETTGTAASMSLTAVVEERRDTIVMTRATWDRVVSTSDAVEVPYPESALVSVQLKGVARGRPLDLLRAMREYLTACGRSAEGVLGGPPTVVPPPMTHASPARRSGSGSMLHAPSSGQQNGSSAGIAPPVTGGTPPVGFYGQPSDASAATPVVANLPALGTAPVLPSALPQRPANWTLPAEEEVGYVYCLRMPVPRVSQALSGVTTSPSDALSEDVVSTAGSEMELQDGVIFVEVPRAVPRGRSAGDDADASNTATTAASTTAEESSGRPGNRAWGSWWWRAWGGAPKPPQPGPAEVVGDDGDDGTARGSGVGSVSVAPPGSSVGGGYSILGAGRSHAGSYASPTVAHTAASGSAPEAQRRGRGRVFESAGGRRAAVAAPASGSDEDEVVDVVDATASHGPAVHNPHQLSSPMLGVEGRYGGVSTSPSPSRPLATPALVASAPAVHVESALSVASPLDTSGVASHSGAPVPGSIVAGGGVGDGHSLSGVDDVQITTLTPVSAGAPPSAEGAGSGLGIADGALVGRPHSVAGSSSGRSRQRDGTVVSGGSNGGRSLLRLAGGHS
jgi:hypothetical protein